jgi:paraquat-inducible protein A
MNDIQSGIVLCSQCHLVINQKKIPQCICPRCRQKLSYRKKGSAQKTLALTIAALLLYFPANIYPIMIIEKFNHPISNTIMSGIIDLFTHGMFFVGGIVFLASIVIPAVKIIVLLYLLYQTNHPSHDHKINTKLFHILEFIGKWSMLDIYVIAIFMALVNLGFFTKVSTGPASVYFTLVVFSTLLASHSFDSRLLWDQDKGKPC